MQIFYIDIKKFKQTHNKEFLEKYSDKNFLSEKRFYEHTIGRFLINECAKKYYNIKNTEIITNSKGKPVFKNSDLNFSISHSGNFVIACFDNNNCAIDIEYIKPRKLSKFEKHYNKKFNNTEDFYKFWTYKEALYKLNDTAKSCYYNTFKKEYALTILSSEEKNINPVIIEF